MCAAKRRLARSLTCVCHRASNAQAVKEIAPLTATHTDAGADLVGLKMGKHPNDHDIGKLLAAYLFALAQYILHK